MALSVAIVWLLAFPPGVTAGLFRFPAPDGATCEPNPTEDTPADCTAVAPANDRAVIFDAYTTTASKYGKNLNLNEEAAVKQALVSEHYRVSEDEGPDGYHWPLLSSFVAIAKQAPGVIFISSHGFDPGSASRECIAAKGLMRAYGDHHPAARLTPNEHVVCRNEAGLSVQPEPSVGAMDRAYKQYLQAGYSDDWIEPLKSQSLIGKSIGYLVLTADGIKHFFGDLHTALVIADACHSMAFDDDFAALSYVGFTSTACDHEDAIDIPVFFDRLLGKAGVPARTTTGAFELEGFKSPVIDLAYERPVVLSPAVVSATPCASMSVCGSTGGLLMAGASTAGSVAFDAAMDTTNTTGVVDASGCGASISNVVWDQSDPTTLTFDVTVPAGASAGTVTLTVHNQSALAAPGGFANDPLDGNPTGSSGVAPNGDDYVWQVPCVPMATACGLMSSVQAQQWFGAADVADDPVQCATTPDAPTQGDWDVQVTTAQQQAGQNPFAAIELDVTTSAPVGYLAGQGAAAWASSVDCPVAGQAVAGVGDAAYYCGPWYVNDCPFSDFTAQKGTDWISEKDSCIEPEPPESTEASLMNTMLASLTGG